MKNHVLAFAIVLALTSAACGLLTPAVESDLNKTGIAVLCSLEEEELADPALDADCQSLASASSPLTASQKAAIVAHSAKARASRPVVRAADGGAQ